MHHPPGIPPRPQQHAPSRCSLTCRSNGGEQHTSRGARRAGRLEQRRIEHDHRSDCCSSTLERAYALEVGSPRGQCPLGCCAPRCGWARAHTQLRTARMRQCLLGGCRAASLRAQLALRLRMAPAAVANEQTVRARVRLRGSSSARAVGAGARRATAQSAATRGWCAGSGGLERCGLSWSLWQTSGSHHLRRQTGKRSARAARCEAAAARRSARGGVRAREQAGAARG
jgi:hypothetical protein